MYDIIIVGAGPAGLTAAIYARRANKTVLIIEKETFGGQITFSPKVENYPGFISMSGNEFADKLIDQVTEQGAELEMDTVICIEGDAGNFTVKCSLAEYKSKSIIIAAGSKHRKLGLENEDKFTGEGVSYCAVCDGAFYKGKNVAVVGGGNSALQEAVLLSDICGKVYVIQNLEYMTGEKTLVEELQQKANVFFITDTVIKSLEGEKSLSSVILKNSKGEEKRLDLDAVFVAIGQQPENKSFENIVALDEKGYIIGGEDCLPKSNINGVFVAGDCRSKNIRQITTATADGAVSALAACSFIDNLNKNQSFNT